MALDPTAALRLYDEAWTISDYESRLVSLRTFWADDGLYLDPDVPEGVRGPEALAIEIERQLKLYPGMSIVSSAPDGGVIPRGRLRRVRPGRANRQADRLLRTVGEGGRGSPTT
jgi:hypothetical protein